MTGSGKMRTGRACGAQSPNAGAAARRGRSARGSPSRSTRLHRSLRRLHNYSTLMLCSNGFFCVAYILWNCNEKRRIERTRDEVIEMKSDDVSQAQVLLQEHFAAVTANECDVALRPAERSGRLCFLELRENTRTNTRTWCSVPLC